MAKQRENRTLLSDSPDSLKDCPTITIEIEHTRSAKESQTTLTTYVLDINNSGMGITCKTLLEVGQTITFKDNDLDWDLPAKGVVMWTFKSQDGFRAGIKFTLP